MNRILEHVLFSNPSDEPRFEKILKKWIEDEEVPAFDKFLKEPASRREARKRKVSTYFVILLFPNLGVMFFIVLS